MPNVISINLEPIVGLCFHTDRYRTVDDEFWKRLQLYASMWTPAETRQLPIWLNILKNPS